VRHSACYWQRHVHTIERQHLRLSDDVHMQSWMVPERDLDSGVLGRQCLGREHPKLLWFVEGLLFLPYFTQCQNAIAYHFERPHDLLTSYVFTY